MPLDARFPNDAIDIYFICMAVATLGAENAGQVFIKLWSFPRSPRSPRCSRFLPISQNFLSTPLDFPLGAKCFLEMEALRETDA